LQTIKTLLFVLITSIFLSCSNLDTRPGKKNPKVSKWYFDQYIKLSKEIIYQNKNFKKVPTKYSKYLKSLLSKNISLDKVLKKTKFYIYKSSEPFFCSLPSGIVILSTALINNYVIEESKLLSVLLFESIKIKYHLYKKIEFMPSGLFDLRDIIRINQISLKTIIGIDRMIFNNLNKTNVDPGVLLRWIQLKNKNVLHFSFMYPKMNIPFKEEYYYKLLLVKEKRFTDKNNSLKNSSKDFYRFSNWTKRL